MQIPQIFMIPEEVIKQFNEKQDKILEKLEKVNTIEKPSSPYITASEYMDAVRIKRSKFDDLRHKNLIQTLEKSRKVYVLATEVERFFTNPNIK